MTTDYYSHENHGDFELAEIGNIIVGQNDETLRNCKIAYRTFGKLNAEKSNAVLVTTWFSGTGKVMEDVYIGEEHTLNPDKYFIIVVDQIGAGTSSSPHNTPAPQSMANFPDITIGDDVRAQHKLLTVNFGISSLELVVGGSMGGQQVYEWCVRYPDMVKHAAMIACTARISHHQKIFTEALAEALKSDPAWNDGWYELGTDVRNG